MSIKSYRYKAFIVLGLFISIAGSAGGYELSSYDLISTAAEEIWNDIDNSDEFPLLPTIDELKESRLFSEGRLKSLTTQELWSEAHAMAGFQSAYLERLNDYPSEFVFSSVSLWDARTQVLDIEIERQVGFEEGWIWELIGQINNELVGIAGFYGGMIDILSTEDRVLLAEGFTQTALHFSEYLSPEALLLFPYFLTGAAENEPEEYLQYLLKDFLAELEDAAAEQSESEQTAG